MLLCVPYVRASPSTHFTLLSLTLLSFTFLYCIVASFIAVSVTEIGISAAEIEISGAEIKAVEAFSFFSSH